jgi:hypothetical protein
MAFHKGLPSDLPRQQVREAFGAFVTETRHDYWQLRYDDLNSCDVDIGTSDLAVHGPCSDPRLWDALVSILALGNVALVFPDCRGPLIAHEDVASHLPVEMFESFGQPIVVTNGSDVLNELRAV